MISFTPAQLFAGFLALCSAIVCIAGALSAITNAANKAKEPETKQNERITKLEDRVAKHDAMFAKDNVRLESIEEGNRTTQKAILALLSHGIDGNEINALKEAKKDLENYLISGRST